MSACACASASESVSVPAIWVAGATIWTREGEWAMKSVILILGIGLSVIGYFSVHIMLGSEELNVVLGMVKRKLGRTTGKFGGA